MQYAHFQKLNVLPPEDFQKIIKDKEKLLSESSVTRKLLPNGLIETYNPATQKKNGKLFTNVYQGAISNFNFDVESFGRILPPIFMTLLKTIQQTLIDNDLSNPQPYMARCYRNNSPVKWHGHFNGVNDEEHAEWISYYGKTVPRKKLWLVIYYMHPNWNTEWRGELNVGLVPEETLIQYQCYSNSLVAHTGNFGHGVTTIINKYKGDRDIFLTHWITD